MRIGLVLPATPAYSETFFRSKIKGLQDNGNEVIVFAGRKTKGFDLCPVIRTLPVFSFPPLQLGVMALRLLGLGLTAPRRARSFYLLERRSGRSARQALENLYLNSHILPQQLDWLHFGFATTALRRENTARAMGARMGVSLRGYDISLYPLKHPGCYRLLWERVDKVHTISDALVQKAYALGLSKDIPVEKITPAINTKQFTRSTPVAALSTPIRLLTVARLKWVKGLEYTLEALALLKQQGVSFHYTIIGEGSEYERLAFAAYQLGISEQVLFAGKLPHEQVKAAMEQADIYLQYSLQEGFCNAVLEAQAMGLLCVVSDAEGLPENVLHGETGWVVPKRQPGLLSEQIMDVMLQDENNLQVVRSRAIERVGQDFNLSQQQQAFFHFFE